MPSPNFGCEGQKGFSSSKKLCWCCNLQMLYYDLELNVYRSSEIIEKKSAPLHHIPSTLLRELLAYMQFRGSACFAVGRIWISPIIRARFCQTQPFVSVRSQEATWHRHQLHLPACTLLSSDCIQGKTIIGAGEYWLGNNCLIVNEQCVQSVRGVAFCNNY